MNKESLQIVHLNDNFEDFQMKSDGNVWNCEYKVRKSPNGIVKIDLKEEWLEMCKRIHFNGENIQFENILQKIA